MKIVSMGDLGLAALSHVTAQVHHVTRSLANVCAPLGHLENAVRKSVLKVSGVLTVGNRVRFVRTEAFVTNVTALVSVYRDSLADCVRTRVLRVGSVRVVSSDVPVIMEFDVTLLADAARVLQAGRDTTAKKRVMLVAGVWIVRVFATVRTAMEDVMHKTDAVIVRRDSRDHHVTKNALLVLLDPAVSNAASVTIRHHVIM